MTNACRLCNAELPVKPKGNFGPEAKFCAECKRIKKNASIAAWAERNVERRRQICRDYEARNREERQARKKPGYKKKSKNQHEQKMRRLERNPTDELYRAAKARAKRKGVPFNIEQSDLRVPETCPVLGVQLIRIGGRRTDASPSVDRTKPELGYVKGNVQVISWRANNLKSNATVEELKAVLRYLESL